MIIEDPSLAPPELQASAIWQKAVDLAELVHWGTQSFPAEESTGLARQLRETATSVSSRIAEGHAHATVEGLARSLQQAHSDLFRLTTEVLVAERMGCLDDETATVLQTSAGELAQAIEHHLKRLTAAV